MTLSAKQQQDITKRLAAKGLEYYNAAVKDVLKEGFGMFKPEASSAEQRDWYEQNTNPEDVEMLRDPDYLEKLKAGFYPLPQSRMWLMFMQLPPVVVKHFLADYRRLMNREEQRMSVASPASESSGVAAVAGAGEPSYA